MKNNDKKWKRMEVVFELLVFGIAIGIIEDLIAIKLTTDAQITPAVIGIVVVIAVPFAILGEVVFDKIDFAKIFKKMFGGK